MKTTRNIKKKHNKIVIPAKSKLNNTETLISQELIDSEISHEEFKTINNEEEKCLRMKENIKMMKNQKSDTEKYELKEEGEKIETNKFIRENNGNG